MLNWERCESIREDRYLKKVEICERKVEITNEIQIAKNLIECIKGVY